MRIKVILIFLIFSILFFSINCATGKSIDNYKIAIVYPFSYEEYLINNNYFSNNIEFIRKNSKNTSIKSWFFNKPLTENSILLNTQITEFYKQIDSWKPDLVIVYKEKLFEYLLIKHIYLNNSNIDSIFLDVNDNFYKLLISKYNLERFKKINGSVIIFDAKKLDQFLQKHHLDTSNIYILKNYSSNELNNYHEIIQHFVNAQSYEVEDDKQLLTALKTINEKDKGIILILTINIKSSIRNNDLLTDIEIVNIFKKYNTCNLEIFFGRDLSKYGLAFSNIISKNTNSINTLYMNTIFNLKYEIIDIEYAYSVNKNRIIQLNYHNLLENENDFEIIW